MSKVIKPTNKERTWKRGYKACLNCRARKVRCDLGPYDNPHSPPCLRCKREQRECLFTSRDKRSNYLISESVSLMKDDVTSSMTEAALLSPSNDKNDKLDKISTTETNDPPYTKSPSLNINSNISFSPIKRSNNILSEQDIGKNRNTNSANRTNNRWKLGINSMQNTLEFLANAAGSVAKEDRSINRTVEGSSSDPSGLDIQENENSKRHTPFLDPSDENIFAPLLNTTGSQRAASSLIEKVRSMRPTLARKLSDIDFIGNSKLISEREAVELIDAFFLTMYPYFPNIPIQLQDPEELAEYPILLCAILTISSRYHPFSEFGLYNGDDNKRNLQVHEKLWTHCQWMISQTIWAEASTRSIGTVLAFIILTEWNPRQIHWRKSDYANKLEKSSRGRNDDVQTGVGAIRRSDRMAWMLTGSAVRLAQDMGFIETSTKIFVAAHISDTFATINMNQRSVLADTFSAVSLGINNSKASLYESEERSDEDGLGNERFYLDQILSNDDSRERWKKVLINAQDEDNLKVDPLTDLEREFLNDEYVLYYSNKESDAYQQNTPLPFALNFSHSQRAKIELVRITLIGYDTIYYEKGKKKLSTNDQVHNLAILDILSPLLDGWYSNYKDLLKQPEKIKFSIDIRKNKRAVHQLSDAISRESILSDFYYCQLYIYSLALQIDSRDAKLRVNEMTKSAKYVELAYNAAKKILESASRVHGLKMLKYMPVRWVMRIVRSVSFLVKCYLTLTGSGGTQSTAAQSILKLCCISPSATIHTINLAALVLREATPDELHLCVRYSAILLYLCKELKLEKIRNQNLLFSHGIIVNEHRNNEQTEGNSSNHQKIGTPENISQEKRTIVERSNFNYTNNVNTSDSKDLPEIAKNNNAINPDVGSNTSILEMNYDNNNTNMTSHENLLSQDTADEFPSLPDQVIDWFSVSDDIGLDFVEPWTQMIEQKYLQSTNNDTEDIFTELNNQLFNSQTEP